MTDPAELAARLIRQVMSVGSAKDGCTELWRKRHEDFHLDRALRHAVTHRLIRDGHQLPDHDDHLALALTRLAMALTVREDDDSPPFIPL